MGCNVHVVLDPLELIERLVALIPPPRANIPPLNLSSRRSDKTL